MIITSLVPWVVTAISSVLTALLIVFRKVAPHIVETWWDDLRNSKRAKQAAKPPGSTLLIAEDLTTVPPRSWRIRNHDQNGDATGFRALLFLTRTENYGNVTITSTEARLPWRLRRKHRVVGVLYQ